MNGHRLGVTVTEAEAAKWVRDHCTMRELLKPHCQPGYHDWRVTEIADGQRLITVSLYCRTCDATIDTSAKARP